VTWPIQAGALVGTGKQTFLAAIDPKRRYASGGYVANPSRDLKVAYSLSEANVALDFF
jgi:hypothetical protein